jgi:hypothetical protein
VNAYLVMKRFDGYETCPAVDRWYERANRLGGAELAGQSFAVNPGNCPFDTPLASCTPRDPAQFETDVIHMAASSTALHLIFSFNDWADGTAVESAQEWASSSGYGTYLYIIAAHPDGS